MLCTLKLERYNDNNYEKLLKRIYEERVILVNVLKHLRLNMRVI